MSSNAGPVRNVVSPMTAAHFLPLSAIRTIGLVGAGSVGKGWAALLLARGYDIAVHDPAADPAQIGAFITQAFAAAGRASTSKQLR